MNLCIVLMFGALIIISLFELSILLKIEKKIGIDLKKESKDLNKQFLNLMNDSGDEVTDED